MAANIGAASRHADPFVPSSTLAAYIGIATIFSVLATLCVMRVVDEQTDRAPRRYRASSRQSKRAQKLGLTVLSDALLMLREISPAVTLAIVLGSGALVSYGKLVSVERAVFHVNENIKERFAQSDRKFRDGQQKLSQLASRQAAEELKEEGASS